MDLIQAIKESATAIGSIPYTYCLKLISEVLIKKTEHFTQEDVHATADGFVAVYLCAIDGRKYNITVKEVK